MIDEEKMKMLAEKVKNGTATEAETKELFDAFDLVGLHADLQKIKDTVGKKD